MKIEIKWYWLSGAYSHTGEYESSEAAFDALQSSNRHALAHPVGTTSGCYDWNPTKEHTLEGFEAKMALCCNSAAEYSDNLIRAGICKGGVR